MKNINCNFQSSYKEILLNQFYLMKLYNTISKREIVYIVQIEKNFVAKVKVHISCKYFPHPSQVIYTETFCLATVFPSK